MGIPALAEHVWYRILLDSWKLYFMYIYIYLMMIKHEIHIEKMALWISPSKGPPGTPCCWLMGPRQFHCNCHVNSKTTWENHTFWSILSWSWLLSAGIQFLHVYRDIKAMFKHVMSQPKTMPSLFLNVWFSSQQLHLHTIPCATKPQKPEMHH